MVPCKIDDPQNYECLLHFGDDKKFDLQAQPHVIIFADDKVLTAKIAMHLEGCLPPEHRGKGVVKHYHSAMSKLYLEQTHSDFVSPTGTCRILIATSGESVGIDFPNVKIVCTLGLPSTIVDALQRGGRAIRTGDETALFIVFHEQWALDIKESEFMDGTDPDRPRANLGLHPRAQERAPLSAVRLVQCKTCLRKYYAEYLCDEAENGA
ncbi:hypothetical protein BDN70DRAFT_821377 [Pholiota conissans]|uniref:DNA 3'-5' helicase n=1 Tax=Pholiota conissans TaxID=109636 RepID=A0A9P5YK74_9AGAR|nr:hypothetical protein BDN70DRAFT_821377 [Pholiota conissans]